MTYDRNETILLIRASLRKRSGKAWSVRGGQGTAWGWIDITAPPKRLDEYGCMTEADAAELGVLLGLDPPCAHRQGVSVAGSMAYRAEYVDRAAGRVPATIGVQYWD